MTGSIDILLLGSGGREDALAWAMRQSPSCGKLLAAPGNPGIARWAECVGIDPADPDKVVALAREQGIGLVVVGPEAPLVAGVADACRAAGIPDSMIYRPKSEITLELYDRAIAHGRNSF